MRPTTPPKASLSTTRSRRTRAFAQHLVPLSITSLKSPSTHVLHAPSFDALICSTRPATHPTSARYPCTSRRSSPHVLLAHSLTHTHPESLIRSILSGGKRCGISVNEGRATVARGGGRKRARETRMNGSGNGERRHRRSALMPLQFYNGLSALLATRNCVHHLVRPGSGLASLELVQV